MASVLNQHENLIGKVVAEASLKGNVSSGANMNGRVSIPNVIAGGLDAEEVEALIAKYIKVPKIGQVTLLADAWVGENNRYLQVVSIEGVTENSQVDLTPSVEQLEILYEKDLTFVTENENGVVTIYAIGQKPLLDYTIQVTITEVSV